MPSVYGQQYLEFGVRACHYAQAAAMAIYARRSRIIR